MMYKIDNNSNLFLQVKDLIDRTFYLAGVNVSRMYIGINYRF